MILIAGLGNPGEQYKHTRHNIGFRLVDELHKNYEFSDFKLSKKENALISQGRIENEEIILAKPQTFMNNSGRAIKQLCLKYKIISNNLWIIHDDVDLPLGTIRIASERGSAGHKGVESIIKEMKTKEFVRFRIGIKSYSNLKAEQFVLKNFTKDEEKALELVIKNTLNAVKASLNEGIEKAMSSFN